MGFIKLSDDLPNWAWYGDNNTLSVYIRLLIGAVWQRNRVPEYHLAALADRNYTPENCQRKRNYRATGKNDT